MKFLVATKNKNKLKEIAEILEECGMKFILPSGFVEDLPEIEESGSSFEENASLKAAGIAKFAKEKTGENNVAAICDDSGLEIEALGGAPGIFSSRYAGTDEKRIERVLRELEELEKKSGVVNRAAHFVCVIAVADSGGVIEKFRGEVRGQIISAPRGSNGFGYDPVFVPDSYDKTFAELPSELKNKISHRSSALKKFKAFLENNPQKQG